jgi:peptidyl-prolyl cis-trans isomerase A (cyclophilin A)
MEAVPQMPAQIAPKTDAPAPAPVPEERKGGTARAFVAVAIVIIFLAGAGAAFYTGSLRSSTPAPVNKPPVDAAPHPTSWVSLNISYGDIVIGLYGNETPNTVKNFLELVNISFFQGTIFHRIIRDFMIQGGGFTPELQQKPEPFSPIKLEINNKLHNTKYTVAMARTSDPDSATTQFFINTNDNRGSLDASKNSDGYAVFGIVVKGTEVVDRIAAVNVEAGWGDAQPSRPTQDVLPGLIIANATIVRNPG